MLNTEQANMIRQLTYNVAKAVENHHKSQKFWPEDVAEAKEKLVQSKQEMDDFLNSITVM